MPVVFREFTSADFAEVLTFWSQIEGLGLSSADTIPGLEAHCRRNPGMSFVACDNTGIIGTALGAQDGRRGFIYHLAVAPPDRGKGIGRELVERTVAAIRTQGIEKFHIVVYQHNVQAQAFWQRLGWEKRDNLLLMSLLP